MVLHLAAIAKLNFIFGTHGLSPVLAALIWPFLIKLAFSTRLVHQDLHDVVHGSRLLLFQLQRIVAAEARGGGAGAAAEAEPRWQRAVRVVYRRARQSRGGGGSSEEEDALHTLTMIAL